MVQNKPNLDQNIVFKLLSILGYTIVKNFKFKLRVDEKTASAIINKDGTIHDYGSDFHGDIYNILETYHGMSFTDALTWVNTQLSITENTPVFMCSKLDTQKNDDALKRIAKTMQDFETTSKKYITLKNDRYKLEALALCPLFLFEQANHDALKKFKNITTFDIKNNTIVIKIHNYHGALISFKWRRFKSIGKWISAKGTHPNNQCLTYITDDSAPIYIVEGHHDFITGILLNNTNKTYTSPFNVLMVPTVNYTKFNKIELDLLREKDVYFLPDLDDKNTKGIDSFVSLAEQIEDIANDVAVVSLAKFLQEYNDELPSGKLDLSEAIKVWKDHDSYSFVNLLHYFCDTGLKFSERGVF